MCEWDTNSVKFQGVKIREILSILGHIHSVNENLLSTYCQALTQEEVAPAFLEPREFR